ncbi:phage Gp37/Gp68 family protein [Desulfovibrio inopinatus]|uniref:phage Gp37/Gp68 family protein n=1 Tax=Desulfovibrio inopinatus TaxID=102109 RepID=UPI0003FF0895|nr:phage Gp37/Gp68 family protein [Desulfovibrio inopinatus]
MADNTKINWADATWNPIIGCSKISPACDNCYAERTACRLAQNPKTADTYSQVVGCTSKAWNGKTAFVESALEIPLHWKRPRRIFVGSMTDIFHPTVQDEWLDHVFAVMALCPQHTFMVLTKRPEGMREYVEQGEKRNWAEHLSDVAMDITHNEEAECQVYNSINGNLVGKMNVGWPMRNVWLGVTVENQQMADYRIPILLNTPAAVRFVSCEPLLGKVNLHRYMMLTEDNQDIEHFDRHGWAYDSWSGGFWGTHDSTYSPEPGLHWAICGGESGPNARPMHPDWVRSLRDQCGAANVPFWFKQWGEWTCTYDRDDDPDWRNLPKDKSKKQRFMNLAGGHGFHGERVVFMERVGSKKSGRLLDGAEHNGLPG